MINRPFGAEKLSDYDVEITFKNVPFEQNRAIIQGFLDTVLNEHWMSEDGDTTLIDVNGYWGDFNNLAYATFVIDNKNRKMFLRIRKPTITLHLDDCISHRDAFSEFFFEYLTSKDIIL